MNTIDALTRLITESYRIGRTLEKQRYGKAAAIGVLLNTDTFLRSISPTNSETVSGSKFLC